jgi:cytochrome c oxidase subunit 1
MPLTVWSIFITAILVLFATPVLAAAALMQLMDHVAHTSFFLPHNLMLGPEKIAAAGGGQPLLWQHLFWFYSHPAVYIMILPAMGMASDIISTFSRKPIFGYRPMVYAIAAIAGLGFIVWGHHMFMSGMNPALGTTFTLSTIMIALPSAVKTFNWLGTMWGGNIRFTVPMLNAIAFVSMFVIGGLSGIFMASTPVDIFIHDTYFIVAHIHYVLFGGSMFGIFAGVSYWFPKMYGRMMNATLGKIHFFLTFIFFNCTFFPMHILGMGGMPRRYGSFEKYEYLGHLMGINTFVTISALLLGAVQVLFIVNYFWSIFMGPQAVRNPWHANTLEWCAAPSPPPHGNFPETPVVYRGPYEYSVPGSKQDYQPQHVPDAQLV